MLVVVSHALSFSLICQVRGGERYSLLLAMRDLLPHHFYYRAMRSSEFLRQSLLRDCCTAVALSAISSLGPGVFDELLVWLEATDGWAKKSGDVTPLTNPA